MDQLHHNQNGIVANMQGEASVTCTHAPPAVSTSGDTGVGAMVSTFRMTWAGTLAI